jgi:hypothetical protein
MYKYLDVTLCIVLVIIMGWMTWFVLNTTRHNTESGISWVEETIPEPVSPSADSYKFKHCTPTATACGFSIHDGGTNTET